MVSVLVTCLRGNEVPRVGGVLVAVMVMTVLATRRDANEVLRVEEVLRAMTLARGIVGEQVVVHPMIVREIHHSARQALRAVMVGTETVGEAQVVPVEPMVAHVTRDTNEVIQ